MQATAKDLRFRTEELLEAVIKGEEVVITHRGKPCAKLVPIEADSLEEKEDELFGIWKDATESADVDAYMRKLRKGRFSAD